MEINAMTERMAVNRTDEEDKNNTDDYVDVDGQKILKESNLSCWK